MSIVISNISEQYTVKRIQEDDTASVHELYKGNPIYFERMKSDLTLDSVKQDLKALPPDKGAQDKFYMGFYKEEKLIAIMDLIVKYPDKDTAYIGLFMLDKESQGQGIGTGIMEEVTVFLKKEGFSYVKLGCIQENQEGEKFWQSNQFQRTGVKTKREHYTILSMQREL